MSTVIEHNCETGEIVERDQTAAEVKQAEKDALEQINSAKAKQDKADAKAAVLEKLGISEAEAKILLS
jgi:hypothetical protein